MLSILDVDAILSVLLALDVESLRHTKAVCRQLAGLARRALRQNPKWVARRMVAANIGPALELFTFNQAGHTQSRTALMHLAHLGATSSANLVDGLQECRSSTELRSACSHALPPSTTMRDIMDGIGSWEKLNVLALDLIMTKGHHAVAEDDVVADALQHMRHWPIERTAFVVREWARRHAKAYKDDGDFWEAVIYCLQDWGGVGAERAVAALLHQVLGHRPSEALAWLDAEWADATQLGTLLHWWAQATETERLDGEISDAIMSHYFITIPNRSSSRCWPSTCERLAMIVEEAFACGPDDPPDPPELALLEWLRGHPGASMQHASDILRPWLACYEPNAASPSMSPL